MKRLNSPDTRSAPRRPRRTGRRRRWGTITVLAAFLLIMIFGFTAFSVDLGFIALTKTQLQSASDAAALAAAMELSPNLGYQPTQTPTQASAIATTAASTVAAANRAGDRDSIYLDQTRDTQFGQLVWDPIGGTWKKTFGVQPYNMVEVTLHRDQATGADGKLPLFFAPVIGNRDASLSTKATAALVPASGFSLPSGSSQTIGALPFALDQPTWDALLKNQAYASGYTFSDSYCYNADGTVSSGSDGTYEVNLYPEGNATLPPGNRGTVDLGAPNNSTNDIKRQILYGLNAYDLSFFTNGEIRTDNGPITLQGDTGLSAGFKSQLETIKGQSRLIPIFSQVSGNGNNAQYTIVKFVGVRVMNVKLTGNPKAVIIQPCTYVGAGLIKDKTGAAITTDTIFTRATLVN